MSYAAYLPFLVQITLAAVITGGVIFASQMLGKRALPSKIKDAAYECGILSDGSTHTRFSVKFYVTAMLFILFDIEAAFLIPWAVTFKSFTADRLFVLAEMGVFLGILVAGFLYIWWRGALEWE